MCRAFPSAPALLLAFTAPFTLASQSGDLPRIEPIAVVFGASPGETFDLPMGVAIDARRGEVLVANTGKHRIDVFDLSGRPRGRYAHQVRGADGALIDGRPTKLAIDAAGRTLIADQRASYVDVVDFRGRSLATLDLATPAEGCAAASGPSAMAVTASGEILVAARGDQGRIHRFSPRYQALGCWGEPGPDSAQLSGITGVAVLPEGRVVVTCATSRFAVQIFEADGRFVHGFGVHDIGDGNFSFPSAVTTTADGSIWVSDEIRQSIQVFDSAGRYRGMLGGEGVRPGEFLYPSALASDGAGHLAVSERVGSRLQVLRIH